MCMRKGFLGCAAAALGLSALVVGASAQEAQTATASIKDSQGQQVGIATLNDTPNGVLVTVEIAGIPEGAHGFHIHAVGQCEPPFQSAGGHFNPENNEHGFKSENGPHAGDLPNLYVPASGELKADVFASGLELDSLFDDDGSALVIHASADDYETDPSGNAGDRIACGVITAK